VPAGSRITTRARLLAFIVALEIVTMISPFAMFFYAVFNPFLLALASPAAHPVADGVLSAHMVVPPDPVLATIRVLGSLLFVLGLLVFLVCAIHVYAGKRFKAGVASRGLYAVIRHPQYVALGVSGIGLAILWPRVLTLVLLAVMLSLCYLLAHDEERRMLSRYGGSYRAYMGRTGMFLPRRRSARSPGTAQEPPRIPYGGAVGVFAVLLFGLVASAFLLREYTIRHLPLVFVAGVDAIGITAGDAGAARAPPVLEDSAVAAELPAAGRPGHRLLAYVIPIDYAMQGMIAETGEEWRLFERHKTIGMITEYVVHPFAHLTEPRARRGRARPRDEHARQPGDETPDHLRRCLVGDAALDAPA
jgi:protein-S-isoprenylcysteine O-methyltransferase Ste14